MTPALGAALFVAGQSGHAEMTTLLKSLGFTPQKVDGADAMNAVLDPVSVCVIDLQENGEALRVARAVRSRHPRAVVIGIADPARPGAAADAIRAGVFDVLPRQATALELQAVIANGRAQAALAPPAASASAAADAAHVVADEIICASPAMRGVVDLLSRAAATRCGIVVCGERGTGREMVARAIHAQGSRADRPFIRVHCAGPGAEELELHLFGSTIRRPPQAPERRSLERLGRDSRLVEASGGVLFLENVLDLPLRVQTRLARVLRDGQASVDETDETVALDIRPMASVDRPLEPAVDQGRFRRDLCEQVSVLRIDLPPLRQRREDIPALATHFLKALCRANDLPVKSLSSGALSLLSALPWRGNALELRGLLERLILLVPGGLIKLEDVLAHTQFEATITPAGFEATLRQARARFEHDYIAAVLRHQHGRIAEAARVLGIQRTNLYGKMRRPHLNPPKAGAPESYGS